MDREPHDQSEFEVCPMCLEPIVDASDQAEGHDAIFCEGDGCRAWHHRWCVGVTKKRYALLSVSDAPFYCPCCVIEQQNRVIAALQNTVKTLATQLTELQAKCTEQSSNSPEQPSDTTEQPTDTTEQPWTMVVKKGKGPVNQLVSNGMGKGKGKGKGKGNVKVKNVPVNAKGRDNSEQTHPISKPRSSENSRKSIPIENARKVWGTLRSTTYPVVMSAIKQLTSAPLGERLTIKRKFKTSQNGTIKKWWFVVRGDKSDVEFLEKEWPKVALQTGWKLEPVFRFEEPTSTDSSCSINVSDSPTPSASSSRAVDNRTAPQSSQD